MKDGIHPKYVDCSVTCACGNKFTTKSVKSEVRTDICSECHPFFTGAAKFVDSAGRVDRFLKRYGRKKPEMLESPAETAAEPSAEPKA